MDAQLVVEIAKLYYQQNYAQEDIARLLAVSRSTVSRALKVARERGQVRVTIVSFSPRAVELEAWLYTTFQLEQVIIVPALGDPASDLEAVAQAAASYLDHVAPARGVIGVAGGRTLFAISQQIRPAPRPELSILPVMGGWVSASTISANEVVRAFSARWGAESEMLFSPAFVSDAHTRAVLLREESIRHPLERARQADLVCVSAAPLLPLSTEWKAVHPSISDAEARQLLELGAVGETCAQFLTADGRPLDSWNLEKTIALSVADFHAVPRVLMTGTGVEKAVSILACCRSGFVTALIVTEEIAAEMQALYSAAHNPAPVQSGTNERNATLEAA